MFLKILKFWFTGKDNESYEIMRALTALCVVVMLGYIGFHLVVHQQFDPLAAAGGLGALLFGGGAGAAIKDKAGLPQPARVNVANVENVDVGAPSRE